MTVAPVCPFSTAMAFRKISQDVKQAAIHLYERELLNLQDIPSYCSFSESTWYRVLKLWRETGNVISHPTGARGRTLPGPRRP
ncbi:hypothetical protein AZE42_08954 [Rhizopogon vesiculosus]|uniref:Uncharacterized protein n=1 Tax=Rhizopogon vesiculosus TaxID=180088 RepID=A0A1J8QE61_9AGAM|nr:hypothetical protein AZE42_08954 [Rhizopogon vesiculosus]